MKRALDFAVALLALIALSPLLAIVALLVRARLGSPILFRQKRPGLKQATFELLKFRTMLDRTTALGHPMPDKDRLTSFGKWLRATSLDELPELWNIIRGDMSLVGPRPLLVEYLPLYNVEQARRHDVRPGLTGWAQVSGRNTLSWNEKFQCDVWYVDHRSLLLDIRIVWMTVLCVFRRDGISAAGEATMAKFTGNSDSVVEAKRELKA